MDIFQNERTRVEKRMGEFVPQLEDIGVAGKIIASEIFQVRKKVKEPSYLGNDILYPEKQKIPMEKRFEMIKEELRVYSEKSASLIASLTNVLLDIRSRPENPISNLKVEDDHFVVLWKP